ncbi:hypothetical protein BH23CHL8_BH23CHL8_10600 [soil metagenome]
MNQVGVRELRHQLRRYLARVQAGEAFEVTLLGRPVAELGPPRGPRETLLRLIDAGKVAPPVDPDTTRWPPTVPPTTGTLATDALLAERRSDRR